MTGPFLPPIQSEIHLVVGSPEGVVNAPVAFVVIDALTGDVYVKRTPISFSTGWGQVSMSGVSGGIGFFTGTGNPEGVQFASPPSLYVDAATGIVYIKRTGIGTNTGWQEFIA